MEEGINHGINFLRNIYIRTFSGRQTPKTGFPKFLPISTSKFAMLAARASTARNIQRIARSFATAVDTAGVKVAAANYNQPTSSVTVLVKAGSRFETKDGVANALKNFAFKVCLTFFFISVQNSHNQL